MDNSTKPPRNVDNNFTEYHSSHQFKDITTESFSDTTSSGIISSSTESYRYIECQLFSGMTWMCDVLIATKRTACISSMAVALLTMLLIVLFKKYRDSFQRMILNLALAAVCYSFAMCIADIAHQPTTICKVQGTLLTLFGWNCCLWIVAIMLNMYFMIVLSIYMKQYEKLLTVFSWGFPCLVAGIPLLRDMFVPAGAWCLVRNDLTWRFGILYFPRIVTFVVMVVATLRIIAIININKLQNNSVASAASLDNIKDDIKMLRIYPLVCFGMNLPSIIDGLYNAIATTEEHSRYSFVLLLAHILCEPLVAAVIAIIYTLDKKTRKRLNVADIREAIESWRRKRIEIKEYNLSNVGSDRTLI